MNTENHYQETDLGNIAPNPRGEYRQEESYEYLDLVVFEGGSYVCLAENGTAITGISPESGKTTQYWQVITIPGSLTPEYIAMHDRVVSLSEQVEADAEEVRTAEQNVSGMKMNVTQMHEQTRQSAEAAERSKDSAAGYAASADASRRAAEESEQNVNAQVSGFDSHVAEKVGEAEREIEAARIAANKAIIAQQEQSVNEVSRVGIEAVSAAQAAAQTATEKAQAAATSEKNASASEKAAKLSEENATKMAEQVAADKEQVANDRTAVENAKQEMAGSAAQIEKNAQGISELKGDLNRYEQNIVELSSENVKFKTYKNTKWMEATCENGYYGGKNFLLANNQTVTLNGVTLTISDGVFTLNGTATANAYILFNVTPFITFPSTSYNIKVFKDSVSISNNFKLITSEVSNFGKGQLPIRFSIYKDFPHDGGNIVDINEKSSATYTMANYACLYIPSGTVIDNLVMRIMLTLAERYHAGDYEYGIMPKAFNGTLNISDMKSITLQSSYDITVVTKTIEYRKLQKDVEDLAIIKEVTDNLFDYKSASGNIITILDGQKATPLKYCTIDGNKSGKVTIIGKNLINWEEMKNYTGIKDPFYIPIHLKPNTVYTYADDSTDKVAKAFLSIKYGGDTESNSEHLCNLIDTNLAHRNSFTFTTNDETVYYLRAYTSTIANLSNAGGFDTMRLTEGPNVEPYEPYMGKEYDISVEMPKLTLSDVNYLFADGNIECDYCKSINTASAEDMPSYWKTYMDSKKFALQKELATMSMNGIAFSFFTDVHIEENTCNSAYLLDYLRDNIGIPFKVFGGDLLNYSQGNEAEAIGQYYKFKELYVNDDRTFCTPGNHDFYHDLGENIFYNVFVKPLELKNDTNGYNDIKRTYYCIDIIGQKTRMIFFDSNDWSSENPSMFEWLVLSLNSIPVGWNCIIFSHILEISTYFGADIPYFAQQYNLRSTGSKELGDGSGTISYDFTSGTGQVICAIGGHSHKDWSSTKFGLPVILTTTDCIGGVTVEHETVDMTLNTTTENAFDVFFIDYDARKIKSIRIGAGSDREWTY